MSSHPFLATLVMILAVLLSGSLFADPTAPVGVRFYVATGGNDAWSGKLPEPNAAGDDGPFATIARARDAVRKWKQTATGDQAVAVEIGDGTYFLDQTLSLGPNDSGSPKARVRYQAAPGKEVRLCGGQCVPPAAFQAVSESSVLARLEPAAHGKVLAADLKALGVTRLGEFPVRYRGAPAVPELFYNDERMTLAHWPNDDWATIAKIIDSGSNPRIGDHSGRPGIFQYDGKRPNRWNVEAGVWLQGYWCFDWYDEVIRIKAIDRQNRQITLAEPHLYSVKQGNPSPRRYCALNLLEELDRPGEFYIDRQAGRLYFWPPGNVADARIVLSTLNEPVLSLENCNHVTIRGFIVETGLTDGVEVSGGTDVRIEACRVRNLRQLGIRVSGGAEHRVEACDIHDTGTGGLLLEGGDRKSLTPAGHEALNNHIWDFSRHQFTSAYGLILGGVGNRAANNLVHDAPHQAIGIQGNDHVLEYNVVHHVCTETDDCGALYKGRNPSCRGNVIRYNFWHHIGSPMGHGNAAIYFDDGDGGDTVFGNVFFRCGEPGKGSFGTVFSHGGHGNLAENNIFIECRRALGSAPWNDKRWKAALGGGQDCLWTERLLQEVDITSPPYTTRYPELVGFMDPQPGQPRVNRAVRNVMVLCDQLSGGNWQCPPEENWATQKDPGFVDFEGGDFRLRPNAEAFEKVPGFQPIPFEKMGLRSDALRPSARAEKWSRE
ncbi:MAG: hypothetical protein GXY83_35600 [Rhodopirellula sp.]|nr:hypothetical protein [Rhodopirellula sp.]